MDMAPGRQTQDETRDEGRGTPLLELSGITKEFPGCLANDRIGFRIMPGEIHALLGENGAGKSTLVKIIYGVLKADEGHIAWQGMETAIAGPAAARQMGIGMVFQHFSLFDSLTVLENIALATTGDRDRGKLREKILEVSHSYGLPLDPDRHVHSLSVGERQRIEIVRCLLQNPKLLILDEPTSVLTPQEVERLFQTLRQLAAEGCAILYISHKLEEVKALCETATVLRGGRVVANCDPRVETARSMAEMMIGEKLQAPSRAAAGGDGGHRLVVSHLSLRSDDQFGTDLDDVSFTVSSGEILGIAGIAGNGQTELMAALTGETVVPDNMDAIVIDEQPVAHKGPGVRRALGAAFVPEERNGHGAVPSMPLTENALLTAFRRMGLVRKGLIDSGKTRGFADDIITRFDVRTSGSGADAGSLSGGNLQKFVVGREIIQRPSVLVISQPTWGVDAGAAAAIHQALLDLAADGAAVLVISQDLDEIFAICDRVAVISQGRLSDTRDIKAVTVDEIGLLMGGLHNWAAEDGTASDQPETKEVRLGQT